MCLCHTGTGTLRLEKSRMLHVFYIYQIDRKNDRKNEQIIGIVIVLRLQTTICSKACQTFPRDVFGIACGLPNVSLRYVMVDWTQSLELKLIKLKLVFRVQIHFIVYRKGGLVKEIQGCCSQKCSLGGVGCGWVIRYTG